MGNSSRPGTIITRTRPVRVIRIEGEYYRVLESTWNGIDGRSYDVERVSDDASLTDDESYDNPPTDADVRHLVEALTTSGELPPPPALPVRPPAPGAPLAVTDGWDSVVWCTGDTHTTATADADRVIGWTGTAQPADAGQGTRILDDHDHTRLVSPYPTAAPGQPSDTHYCTQCATPDPRARDVRGSGPWHQAPCSKHIPVHEWLPRAGTSIALLPHARCVLWLVRGEEHYAPVTADGLVDWSCADHVDRSTWFQDDTEHDEFDAAVEALYRHQSTADLTSLAHVLIGEADVLPPGAAAEAWRDAARLLYVQAERERRAAAERGTLWGAVRRLETVLDDLADFGAQAQEPDRSGALQDVARELSAFTQGDNYRVTLLCGSDYREVVVRATGHVEARQRARDVQSPYFIGGCPPLGGPREIVSVALLTLVPGL